MRIKGLARERKYRKRRYGMRVDGYGVRPLQLALIQRAAPQMSFRGPEGDEEPGRDAKVPRSARNDNLVLTGTA